MRVYSCDRYVKEHPSFSGCLIDKHGDSAWYKNGKWHREDGPALEYKYGTKSWCFEGKLFEDENSHKIFVRNLKIKMIVDKLKYK